MNNSKYISLRGVRQNNLKNINLDLPGNKLIIITGVSGSGKSSLAFDTIFAEGQRRYIESLSPYARQFLEQMDKPEVDSITGIPPSIAIQQTTPPRNSRSTVGTVTEINDYLRLLYARIGKTYCNQCGRQVEKETIQKVMDKIMSLPEESRIFITFPYDIKEGLHYLTSRGYIRVMTKKGPLKIEDLSRDIPSENGKVNVLIDRLKISHQNKGRIIDSLRNAYREGHGKIEVKVEDGEELKFSNNFHCPDCNKNFPEPVPLLFSFNSPYGACSQCHGFGNLIEIDHKLVIPDENKTLLQGAIVPWTTPKGQKFFNRFKKTALNYGIPLDIPYKNLEQWQKDIIWRGKGNFPGIEGFFDMVEEKKHKIHVRVYLSKFRGYTLCPGCNGKRLRKEALYTKIKNFHIADLCAMNAKEGLNFFKSLTDYLTEYEISIAEQILKEIIKRLEYLINVGLDYITLDRLTKTISSGEYHRIKLASCLGSGLTNTLYVLDEPSIGLHARDNEKLITILKTLRNLKNTVIVVEHDPEMIKTGDYIIDIGPGAGEYGGEVVFQGSPEELLNYNKNSLTSLYLRKERNISLKKYKEDNLFSEFPFHENRFITLKGAKEHNLKNIDITIPLNNMVCITGVSGSGKSTLITDILFPALKKEKGDFSGTRSSYDKIEGASYIDDVVMVDQTPIGKTPRSNPVTYIKAFYYIRAIFSKLPAAKVKGLKPGDFSFNVKGGRCEHCEGNGYIKVEMQFMADIYVTCQECLGKRYKNRILDITYKGKNIADVLNMTVREGTEFFSSTPQIVKKLKALHETGLSYLRMGQPANTLSGGEAQRLKLASYLLEAKGKGTLYIFDEPTTGLHLADIEKLLLCLKELINKGNSVLIIEHNMEVIKNSDYIIDLGPEGGDRGGQVIAMGTPRDIIKQENSYTGQYLKKYLE